MRYTKEQRESIIKDSIGKTITDLEYIEDDPHHYWVFTFSDGSEMSFRFMAELVAPRVCSVCGVEIPKDRLTCGEDCHEIAVDFIEGQFGVYKKVVDEVSGNIYKVPVRDIIELGLKQQDLKNYPAWVEEDHVE